MNSFNSSEPENEDANETIEKILKNRTNRDTTVKKQHDSLKKTTEIKLINQGTYGCILRPEINCDDGTVGSVKYISKIQKHNKGVEYELFVSSKIKEIHNYFFYYAILIKECDAILSSISDEEIRKCNILKAIPVNSKKENKYTSTKIRYIGEHSLEKYLKIIYLNFLPKKREDLSSINSSSSQINGGGIFDYFTTKSSSKQSLAPPPPARTSSSTTTQQNTSFFSFGQTSTNSLLEDGFSNNSEESQIVKKIKHTYNYLLFSLNKLNSHGIIHNDIKENNIMIDDNTRNPIFIDFNLSFMIKDIQKPETGEVDGEPIITRLNKIFFYSKFYLYYSIDFYILVYIVNDIFNESSRSSSKKENKNDIIDLQKIKTIVELFLINLYNKSDKFQFYLFDKINPDEKNENTEQIEKIIELSNINDIDNELLLQPTIENIEKKSPEFIEYKNKFVEYFEKTYKDKTWLDLFNDLTKTETMITWDNYSLALTYIIATTSTISSYINVNNNSSIFLNPNKSSQEVNNDESKEESETKINGISRENKWIKIWKEIILSLPNERMNSLQTMEKIKTF